MFSPISIGITAGLGATAALGLAAGGCAYAAMWPASQIFGSTLIAPRRPGELALTFDDGPNPAWTPRLLDVLARSEVHATFFLVGRYAQAEPALVRSHGQHAAKLHHAILPLDDLDLGARLVDVEPSAKTDRKSDRTPRLDRHVVFFHAKQLSSITATVKHGGRPS